jgi:hypothetical protein
VVVIDEAQNLSESVLEAQRMLSNFEAPPHKLIFTWPGFEDYRAASASDSVHASSGKAPLSIDTPPAMHSASDTDLLSGALNPVLHPQRSSVRVHQGKSLYKPCAEAFGECRQEDLREMFKMNPAIYDPRRIKSGQ